MGRKRWGDCSAILTRQFISINRSRFCQYYPKGLFHREKHRNSATSLQRILVRKYIHTLFLIGKLFSLSFLFFWSTFFAFGQESFKIAPLLQDKLQLQSYQGFLLYENTEESWNSNYAVVSNYEGGVLESQTLLGANDLAAAKAFIDHHLTLHSHKGIDIRELTIQLPNHQESQLFWVGHRSFPTLSDAQKAIDHSLDEGISPQEMTKMEQEPEVEVSQEIPSEAVGAPHDKPHYPLKLDKKIQNVEIPGTKIESEKDRFYYQVFGEFSYRRTNFDFPRADEREYYDEIGGFMTHRFVMKGIHFYQGGPSLDPFVEGTYSLSTRDEPFDNKIEFVGGLEYRPLEGLELLIKNPYIEWFQRIALSSAYAEIVGFKGNLEGPTYDWINKASLYKDWGWSQPFDEEARDSFDHYLWGELFFSGGWRKTSYTRDDFESFGLETVGWLGVKFPWVGDIPPLMPYVKLEFTTSEEQDFFRNRFLAFAGIRYMPFHISRFKGYEWLYGFKLFAEVGDATYYDEEPPDDRPDWDFRVGIKVDLNRF